MGKTSGANHLAAASSDSFATDPKPLDPVAKCKRGKTLLKAHLYRVDTNAPIDGETIKAAKGGKTLTAVTGGATALADYGVVDPGAYTFSVTLSTDRAKKFKPFTAQGANVPRQVDFHATLKIVPRARLRIVVFDTRKNPIANAIWRLTSPVAANGTTGANGLIEAEVPWNAADATLVVKLPPPAEKVPAPTAVTAPDKANPVYPIAVDWARFLPAEEKCKLPDLDVTWTTEIDLITDADTPDGWKGRLANIGFPITDDERVTRSVKAFQRLNDKNYAGSGVLADISGPLKTLHDKV